MTITLERAFSEASKLSDLEQELLASRILAELADEDEFDRAITNTGGRLAGLASAALEEYRAGETAPFPLSVSERG